MTDSGGFWPQNPALGQEMQTDIEDYEVDRAFIAHIALSALQAVAFDADGVHAAFVATTTTAQTITTDISNPVYPRNITATTAGTADDISAVSAIITGTDMADEVITETLPVFTVNSGSKVEGDKAFKTITSIYVPAMDGVGATIAVGWGDIFGLPFQKAAHHHIDTFFENVKESTAPTFTASATVLSSNTFDLDSTPDGSVIDCYLLV